MDDLYFKVKPVMLCVPQGRVHFYRLTLFQRAAAAVNFQTGRLNKVESLTLEVNSTLRFLESLRRKRTVVK